VRVRVFPEERTLLQTLLDRDRGRGDSSRPEAALALRLLHSLQPALRLAGEAGLLGPRGVLTMPPLEVR